MEDHRPTPEQPGAVVTSESNPDTSRAAANIRRYFSELADVEAGSGDAAPVQRALQSLIYEAIERIWSGDTEVAAEYLDGLEPAMPRIREVLNAVEVDPVVEALQYCYFTIQTLQVIDNALETSRLEKDMRALASETKRTVLRVLLDNPDEHLSRSEIRRRWPRGAEGPSVQRIGQILDELYSANVIVRIVLTVRGGPAAHYQLTPAGRRLCARLFRTERPAEQEREREQSGTWLAESERKKILNTKFDPRRSVRSAA